MLVYLNVGLEKSQIAYELALTLPALDPFHIIQYRNRASGVNARIENITNVINFTRAYMANKLDLTLRQYMIKFKQI